MKIIFLLFSILAGSLAFVWSYKLIWGKPASFNHFVQRVFITKCLHDPEFLSSLGSFENSVWDFHSGKLTDCSSSAEAKHVARLQKDLTILHKYNREKLSAQEKITYDILQKNLMQELEVHKMGYNTLFDIQTPYLINQLFGVQNNLVEFMISIHQIVNKKSAQNYIKRLKAFEDKFANVLYEVSLREKKGIIPPVFVLEKVIEEIGDFVKKPLKENILFIHFKKNIDKLSLSQKEKRLLEEKAIEAIRNNVYPAYEKLLLFLENQKKLATTDAGVWKFPQGESYYSFCLAREATTNFSPEKVHNLGLLEVARIQQEMKQLLDGLGYKEFSVSQAMTKLSLEKRFLYTEAEIEREQILKDFHKIFDRIQDKLPSLFLKIPDTELKIEKIPEFKAKGAPGAYYQPPGLGDSRPGIFFVNLSNATNVPKFGMETLAYHEGIPGHHFQISIAQELKNLPMLRRLSCHNAYAEGWALYAELLAYEQGFLSDVYANLGRLQMELFRAVRLVVDTGIHFYHWDRQKAISYMIDNTGMGEKEVIAEVERYIVLPAQACSYKIGMLKILELREEVKKRKKENFDIKKFHQAILENGSMPLDILEKYVLSL